MYQKLNMRRSNATSIWELCELLRTTGWQRNLRLLLLFDDLVKAMFHLVYKHLWTCFGMTLASVCTFAEIKWSMHAAINVIPSKMLLLTTNWNVYLNCLKTEIYTQLIQWRSFVSVDDLEWCWTDREICHLSSSFWVWNQCTIKKRNQIRTCWPQAWYRECLLVVCFAFVFQQ